MSRTVVRIATLLAFVHAIAAPAPSVGTPNVKGIWEPVNFSEDIAMYDAYFVTPDVGWVAGAKGTILHTRDGGNHWSAQMGGDPQSDEWAVTMLRFIDEKHGWAVWETGSEQRLLHTTDGENWIQIGRVPAHITDYAFTSQLDGVLLHGRDILKTKDGGKRWEPTGQCQAKVEVDGLPRTLDCQLMALSFPTDRTGYAVGKNGANKGAFVMKTEDGGATWSTSVSGTGVEPVDIVFVNESQGYFRNESSSAGELFSTTDGGATWSAAAGSPGARIRFADPEVGWAFNSRKWTFTTDAGRHWASRDVPFPAAVEGFSFPRRDRAFVVGAHGMIFRYRIVPAAEQIAKGIGAPTMPGPDPGLMDATTQLGSQIGRLETDMGSFRAVGDASTPPPADGVPGSAALPDSFVQDVGDAEMTVGVAATQATVVLTRQRNLNLLVTAVEVAAELPQQLQGMRSDLRALKGVHGAAAAAAALTGLKQRVDAIQQTVRRIYQRSL